MTTPQDAPGRIAYQASVEHQITAIGRPEQPFRQWEDLDEPTREYWNAVAQACLAPERARVKRRIEALANVCRAAVLNAHAKGTKDEELLNDPAVGNFYAQMYEMVMLAHHLGIEIPEDLPLKEPPHLELLGSYPEMPLEEGNPR